MKRDLPGCVPGRAVRLERAWRQERTMIGSARQSRYKGIREGAAAGLHAFAFDLFRKYVPAGARCLDLGSGEGAWVLRLDDASYRVTACDLLPRGGFGFPFHRVDLNERFSELLGDSEFDAITVVEVIEHLENPRHTIREAKALLGEGGVLFITTPNASGLYSRLRFFFTGRMAMFTDASYQEMGHITPLTTWQLEKIFTESDLQVLERRFHDARFFPPRCWADLAKIIAWGFCRVFMRGPVGGQSVLYVLKR